MLKSLPAVVLLALTCSVVSAQAADPKVLVYTRNGKGYVHENIATSVAMIKTLGASHGFSVDATDDPKVFTYDNLRRYKAIVFSNSNNEAFENDAQREAFRKFMESGGGLVGIHIATGSERNWPFFWSVMGGKFLRHPKLQKFTVEVKEPSHPATAALPAKFAWEDECYLFEHMNPTTKVLLATDPAAVEDPKRLEQPGELRNNAYALSWYNTLHGGRQFYTALGHKTEHYADPLFQKHVLGGIRWVLGMKAVGKTK